MGRRLAGRFKCTENCGTWGEKHRIFTEATFDSREDLLRHMAACPNVFPSIRAEAAKELAHPSRPRVKAAPLKVYPDLFTDEATPI